MPHNALSLSAMKTIKKSAPYQKWAGFPDSPVLSAGYPYQFLGYLYGAWRLYVSSGKWYKTPNEINRLSPSGPGKQYYLSGVTWVLNGSIAVNATNITVGTSAQYNNDTYTDNTFSLVLNQKTTQ